MNTEKNLINYVVVKPFLLMALSFLFITACNSVAIQRSNISTQRVETISECRVIQHALGETCIPVKPQRIIVLDPSFILDPLLALGFKSSIVGINCYENSSVRGCIVPGFSPHELEGIERVGIGYQPSIEKIVTLKPDLILVLGNSFAQIYRQLSEIAPTVTIDYEVGKLCFKNHLRGIAQLFERKQIAEELIVQYQKRILEVRKQLGERLENMEVSVIIYNGGRFTKSANYAIFFQLLKDIGVKIKPIFLNQKDYTQFSIETIDDYDADILFIANYDRRPASFFLDNPLISSLKAVKSGRTYVIDGREVWDVFGPLGVNKLLDKISQYLLKAIQTL